MPRKATKGTKRASKKAIVPWQQESRAYHVSDPQSVSVFTPTTVSDITVNESTALTFTAVWTSVRLIAGTIASLPCNVYRRDGEEKAIARDNPLFPCLHDAPNDEMTAYMFWETIASHLLLWGNAYAQIIRNIDGDIIGLQLLLPSGMTVNRVSNRSLPTLNLVYPPNKPFHPDGSTIVYRYTYQSAEGAGTAYLFPWDVLHYKGLSYDGYIGYSPIQCAKRAIELGMSAEAFASNYYTTGAHPPYAISHPGVLGEDGVAELGAYIQECAANRTPPVLEEDIKITPFSMDAESSQFLLARSFSRKDIASFFLLRPQDIGEDAANNTYGNREADNRQFLQRSVSGWLERIEQENNVKLFGIGSEYFSEFDCENYLRGDTLSRYQAYQAASDWMTPNEKRAAENLPAVEGGDSLPSQKQPQQQEPPPAAPDQAARAFVPVAAEALRRMATKEGNALARLVSRGDKAGITAFYAEHRSTLYSALQPAVLGLSVLLGKDDALADRFLDDLSATICARALLDSQELANVEAALRARTEGIQQQAEKVIADACAYMGVSR